MRLLLAGHMFSNIGTAEERKDGLGDHVRHSVPLPHPETCEHTSFLVPHPCSPTE